jgi:hypothetical protein
VTRLIDGRDRLQRADDDARLAWCRRESAAVARAGGPVPFYGSRNLRDLDAAAAAAQLVEDNPPAPEHDHDDEWLPPLF